MFDTFNYDEKDKRLLPINLNKGVPGLFEYEIGRKIIIEIVMLRAKTYAYLTDGYNDVMMMMMMRIMMKKRR